MYSTSVTCSITETGDGQTDEQQVYANILRKKQMQQLKSQHSIHFVVSRGILTVMCSTTDSRTHTHRPVSYTHLTLPTILRV